MVENYSVFCATSSPAPGNSAIAPKCHPPTILKKTDSVALMILMESDGEM